MQMLSHTLMVCFILFPVTPVAQKWNPAPSSAGCCADRWKMLTANVELLLGEVLGISVSYTMLHLIICHRHETFNAVDMGGSTPAG